jgi:hypothetical protein
MAIAARIRKTARMAHTARSFTITNVTCLSHQHSVWNIRLDFEGADSSVAAYSDHAIQFKTQQRACTVEDTAAHVSTSGVCEHVHARGKKQQSDR